MMKTAIAGEAVKSSPAVAVTGIAWMNGLTINEIVGIATLAYIALQALYLAWKWHREWKRSRK